MTLRDVAARAAVSPATASLILNNRRPGRFSAETRNRVHEAARALGYRPKGGRRPAPAAADHRAGGSLAFVHASELGGIAEGANPFYSEVLDGIQERARARGYSVTLATGLLNAEAKLDFIERRAGREIAGWLMAGVVEAEVLDRLEARAQPVVFVGDQTQPLARFDVVQGENERGAHLATHHLLELGHERIAWIGCHHALPFYRERLSGYCRALVERGLTPDPALVGDPDRGPGLEPFLEEAVLGPGRATAVFATSRALATRALAWCQARGTRVPDRLSFVGYDDPPAADPHLQPRITAVRVPRREIGRMSVERLLQRMADPDLPPAATVLPAQLVARASVKPPAI